MLYFALWNALEPNAWTTPWNKETSVQSLWMHKEASVQNIMNVTADTKGFHMMWEWGNLQKGNGSQSEHCMSQVLNEMSYVDGHPLRRTVQINSWCIRANRFRPLAIRTVRARGHRQMSGTVTSIDKVTNLLKLPWMWMETTFNLRQIILKHVKNKPTTYPWQKV